jgi:hypothetical protein
MRRNAESPWARCSSAGRADAKIFAKRLIQKEIEIYEPFLAEPGNEPGIEA